MESTIHNGQITDLSPLAKEYLNLVPNHPIYKRDIKPELEDNEILDIDAKKRRTFVTYGMSGHGIDELY